MFYQSKYGKMYYTMSGEGPEILFLHGWGQDGRAFKEVINGLPGTYKIITVDLLGFGKSAEPITSLCLNDYSQVLTNFLQYINVKKPIIIGHSLGGRLAIKYYHQTKNAKTLILVSSAGIKPRRTIRYYLHVYKYKIRKMIYQLFNMRKRFQSLINSSGSQDYQQASDVMKGTLIKIVNEDLRKILKQVDVKTFLIWGINDQEVPYQDALTFNKLIKDSELITFYNSGHFPYVTEKRRFIKVLSKILEGGAEDG